MSLKSFTSAAAAAACGLTLAACAHLPHISPPPPPKPAPPAPPPVAAAVAPAPREVIIKVPAPVKEACVPKAFPRAPKYPDTDAALRDAGGAADRYQLMAAGRLLRDRRLAELEKMVDACR
ncbi:hypothetical protein [Phenylobacterium sp.]|jgi:hypothetical protein|uniref:hypothetical protein n=1 Tax=Phenylobacterium sp. TaxID=1871053 RepID=UPI002E3224E9|nr:hypothetical protein [Phenylobacterium sp.]HEX4709278.1 hypothetical protein [Phenylobacterium sp.]